MKFQLYPDGTLLDLRYDNYFWLDYVPACYAKKHGLVEEQAKTLILQKYASVAGSLSWYCVDYWSKTLLLDIAALKAEISHLIAIHPGIFEFLTKLNGIRKRRVLLSNAHRSSISIKMEQTGLDGYVERIISAHDLGIPKEHGNFWDQLQTIEPFDPNHTVLIDDSLSVLHSARSYGIRNIIAITKPDSQKPANLIAEFMAVTHCQELLKTINIKV
ncbi:haloacid dehalogenase [Achromatium sp. WMS2]|nr:haloacid dehalogenase [Achromatium sp. WMS2]